MLTLWQLWVRSRRLYICSWTMWYCETTLLFWAQGKCDKGSQRLQDWQCLKYMGISPSCIRSHQDIPCKSSPRVSLLADWKYMCLDDLIGNSIAGQKIPTWITPLVLLVVIWILIPNTSFLGHLSGCITGYLCKLRLSPLPCSGFVLTVHRGPWLHSIFSTTGESLAVDWGKTEFAWTTSALRICRPEDIWKIWCSSL